MADVRGTVPPILLIFDGTCGFCTRCARLAAEHAPAGRLVTAPDQTPGLIDRYGLTREDVDRFVWVIGPAGRRWRGAAAIARTLRAMGGAWWLLGCLTALPGASLAYWTLVHVRSRISEIWGDAPPCA
jgi:predicted DCC family thiol-disulfide oxidoreductase YuxK